MELRQLVYAVAVAEHRHFTRASEALHTAQPAVSHQIAKLEKELGVTLFERGRAGVRVTAHGAVVIGRARRILAEVDALAGDVAALDALERGRVEIGAMHNLGPVDLAAMIAAFRRRHPGLDVALREVTSDVMFDMVGADRLDLAIAALDVAPPAKLTARVLARERLVMVVPRSHPLAGAGTAAVTALAGEPFVAFSRGTGLRAVVDEATRAAGFEPRIHVETSDMARLVALVADGAGVAMIPASTPVDGHAVAVVDLDPAPVRTIGLIWREARTLSPAAEAFRRLTLEFAAGAPSQK